MTCIVGIEHGGKVWLGGDSAASDGSTVHVRSEPKVWTAGEFAFGFCGSFRYGALLRYAFKPPKPPKKNVEEYFAVRFIPALRDCFAADLDAQPSEAGRYPSTDFLIGLHGRLYIFEGDWQIGRCRDGFSACGSGDMVATGALYATPKLQPRQRLLTALNAAERYTVFVRAPFTFVSV